MAREVLASGSMTPDAMYEFRVPSPRVVVRHIAVHCTLQQFICGCVELVGGTDSGCSACGMGRGMAD
jgi:hypothetical protein